MGEALETGDQQLQRELEQLELELFGLKDEIEPLKEQLDVFERTYLRTVGPHLLRLTDLQARLAELRARRDATDNEAAFEAESLRNRATRLREEARQAEETEDEVERAPPSESLSELRRKAAKLFHPDLADDEDDRSRREQFMKEANSAFADRNLERLQEVIDRWLAGARTETGITSRESFRKLTRKVERAKQAIMAARNELSELRNSDLYYLMADAKRAETAGRDLLSEMVDGIQLEIHDLQRQLEEMGTF